MIIDRWKRTERRKETRENIQWWSNPRRHQFILEAHRSSFTFLYWSIQQQIIEFSSYFNHQWESIRLAKRQLSLFLFLSVSFLSFRFLFYSWSNIWFNIRYRISCWSCWIDDDDDDDEWIWSMRSIHSDEERQTHSIEREKEKKDKIMIDDNLFDR